MKDLKVFISPGCRGCKQAQELAGWLQSIKPGLSIRVIDLSLSPDAGLGFVFAVPTYVYNSKTLFVGNPSPQELQKWLDGLESGS